MERMVSEQEPVSVAGEAVVSEAGRTEVAVAVDL